LASVAALACQSELADGMSTAGPKTFNPNGTPVTPGAGGPAAPGTTGGNGEVIVPVGGIMNSQGDRKASISGTGDVGALVDANGFPLPLDQLPALQNCDTPGPQLIRRLTSEQYGNTLSTIFGEGVPSSAALRDATTLGYNIDADDSLVEGVDAQSLMNLAEMVGDWATTNNVTDRFSNGCEDRNNNDCRQNFVKALGEKISREPLDQGRVDRFASLFNAKSDDGIDLVSTWDEGAAMVVTAMVQSPYLLYRRELGTNMQNGKFQLTGYEVASELSYLLTNNAPDQALMDAAKNNQLSSPDQIQAQADRLLATDQAKTVLKGFVRSWLDINRLTGKVKSGNGSEALTTDLRQDMLQETEALFVDVFENNGTISDLFDANYTFLNKRLSDFYGIQGGTSDNFERVDISDGRRVPGILGQGSYLTAHALADNSSPVQRAFVVRERLLCDDLPEVPTNLDTNLKPQDPNATSRQRYAAHSENPVCYACHQLMDPIGFTFESWDSMGRFRETEANQPVDPTGALPLMNESGPTGVSYPLADVNELADYLAVSESSRACLANNFAYYAYGVANVNKWSPAEKVCTDHYVRQVARSSGNTLRSVLTGILTAPHFTTRLASK
jgi:uncharacterized protein DUF1592/uncharacterized protein DUF1588/uncharacterized protein DUF1595/uncharacterized protein DUF1587